MGTGNFPFFKNSPSVLAAQLWSLEVQNILPRNLRQWTLPSGRQGLSPCSGVSGSHSQIPESQEQVGLSILMLQNIPEGRSPEWVFFFFFPQEGNWVIRRSPVGLTSGVPVNTQAVSSLTGPTSMRTRKAERP